MKQGYEARGLNPYFAGLFEGESGDMRALRLTLVNARDGLRMDAERGAFLVKHGSWLRYDECTMLCIRLPAGTDLSCPATRAAALDAAMAAHGALGAA